MNFDKPTVLPRHIPEIISPYPFGKVLECENLGGIPNTTYKVIAERKTFAVRIYSHGQSSMEHINMELKVLKHLEKKGFRSPRLLSGKNGKILQLWKGYPVCATDFILGKMADSIKIIPELAFNVGKTTAKLRKAMASFEIDTIPDGETFIDRGKDVVDSLSDDLKKRMWVMDISNVAKQWERSSRRFVENKNILESNILSADIWPPNIKCEGSEIVALMDFDDCCYGATIIDFSIALMSFSMFQDVKIDKDIARSLLIGYFNAGGNMTSIEESLIVDAIEMTCAMWLGYNVSQAPRVEQAEIYLLILNILNDEQKRRKFSDDITKVVNEAKKNNPK